MNDDVMIYHIGNRHGSDSEIPRAHALRGILSRP